MFLWLICCWLMSPIAGQSSASPGESVILPHEKQLGKVLQERYRALGILGRPVRNSSKTMVVTSALHLVQILDLDEHNQILTSSMKVELQWMDEFLTWDSSEFGNLPRVRMAQKHIWVPDIILSNSVAEEERIADALVKISPDGHVTWIRRNVMKSSCQIDMQLYPFDRQKCRFRLKSASYFKHELALLSVYEEGRNLLNEQNTSAYLLNEYIESSEWAVISQVTLSPHIESIEGDELEVTLTLNRKSVFFTWILILPCLFLTMLTLVTFWLPPDRPDKTSLAMNIFASFMVLLLVLVGSIPSTASSIPILGLYYFFNMVITALSIVLATIVVNINKSHQNKPPVPAWLRVIAIETLGGMFGVHMTVSKVEQHTQEQKRRDEERRKMMTEAFTLQHIGDNVAVAEEEEMYETMQRKFKEQEADDKLMTEIEEDVMKNDASSVITDSCTKLNHSVSKTSAPARLDSFASDTDAYGTDSALSVLGTKTEHLIKLVAKVQTTLAETRDAILSLCTHMQERAEKTDGRDLKATEWHQVAVAIDRTFFFLYLTCLVILGIVSFAILLPQQL